MSAHDFSYNPQAFARDDPISSFHHAIKNSDKTRWVMKIPKEANSNPLLLSKNYANAPVKQSDICRGLARMYANMVKDKFNEKVEIDFNKVIVVSDKSGFLPPNSYTVFERPLPNQFSDITKWCNNYNHFSEDLMKEHPHIPAMIHYILS